MRASLISASLSPFMPQNGMLTRAGKRKRMKLQMKEETHKNKKTIEGGAIRTCK
jgi:hypothetical protein